MITENNIGISYSLETDTEFDYHDIIYVNSCVYTHKDNTLLYFIVDQIDNSVKAHTISNIQSFVLLNKKR